MQFLLNVLPSHHYEVKNYKWTIISWGLPVFWDTFIIELSKVKDKEGIWKQQEKRFSVTYKGTPIRGFFSRNLASQEGVGRYIQSAKGKNLPTKNNISGKIILWKWREKYFLRPKNIQPPDSTHVRAHTHHGVHHH